MSNPQHVILRVTHEQLRQAHALMREKGAAGTQPDMQDWEKIVGPAMAYQIWHNAQHDIVMEMWPHEKMTPEQLAEQRTVRDVSRKLEGGNLHPHMGGFSMLPAGEDKCAECATQHAPDMPHNKTSMHYQYDFYGQHGRWPTWRDAMAHCTPGVRAEWSRQLEMEGEKLD